ncbi:MAG: hypothetical protein IPI60_15370 [Saprospiraceae bacterium]|nr:hypothetical protein [Saprospiraceae bacterium]
MNTLKIIASIIVISSFTMSCGNTTDNKSEVKTEAHKEHNQDEQNETIKLSNGEKWSVNEEMKPFIIEAESILTQYIECGNSDYNTLAKKLKEKNTGLIKSCTMQGESHDELHKWLHPHMELIESLSNATTTEEANEIIATLQASFSTYNQYFQ